VNPATKSKGRHLDVDFVTRNGTGLVRIRESPQGRGEKKQNSKATISSLSTFGGEVGTIISVEMNFGGELPGVRMANALIWIFRNMVICETGQEKW